jgi:glutathione synthase/RimK-type ligase-like ATP-grasp enzyme
MDEECAYDVIVDRMSHEIPYYHAFLKYALMQGVYVVNNPFTIANDSKFFGTGLSSRLGLKTPRTVVLPNKTVDNQFSAGQFPQPEISHGLGCRD